MGLGRLSLLPHPPLDRLMSPADAKRRLDLGAALVQVYIGLVYAGPALAQKSIRAID